MAESAGAEPLVVPNIELLSKVLTSDKSSAGVRLAAAIRSELVRNVRLLREEERPIEPVDEAARRSTRGREIEAAAAAADALAKRARMEPALAGEVAAAAEHARPAEPEADTGGGSAAAGAPALPALPENLARHAKLADVSALGAPVQELLARAAEHRAAAARCLEMLQAEHDFDSPRTDQSVTINVEPTTTIMGGTPRSDAGPPGDAFASPDAAHTTRSPFHPAPSRGGPSPRLPAMSPNITPRSRARRELIAKSPRQDY